MVSERELWSERIARWIPGVIAGGIPLLGICYGHQLPAHAIRLGHATWGLQFHPEFSAHVMRAYINEFVEVLEQEGLNVDVYQTSIILSGSRQLSCPVGLIF